MDVLDDMPLAKRRKLRQSTTLSLPPRALSSPRRPIDEPVGQENSRVLKEWAGLPRGVQFIPTDADLLWHLLAKVDKGRADPHPFIHEFITCLDEFTGFGCTHPQNLPGIRKDGRPSYFFHKSFKAHESKDGQNSCDRGGVCWQKSGKTEPLIIDGQQQGYTTVMILHTSMQEAENHKWVMYQYHLEMEKEEGEFVVSKIIFQRLTNENVKDTTLKPNEIVPTEAESTISSESNAPNIHFVDHHLDFAPEEPTSKNIVMVDCNTEDSVQLKVFDCKGLPDSFGIAVDQGQKVESDFTPDSDIEYCIAKTGGVTAEQIDQKNNFELVKNVSSSPFLKKSTGSDLDDEEEMHLPILEQERREYHLQSVTAGNYYMDHQSSNMCSCQENVLCKACCAEESHGNGALSAHQTSNLEVTAPVSESRTSRAKVKEEPNAELLEDMQNKSINNNLENCQQFFPHKMCEPDVIRNAQFSRRKRKKTATDSVKQALEEDAPGLLQILLDKGVSVDDIKLYGASEDDDTLETSLMDDDFNELETVIDKIFSTRASLFKFPVVRPSKSSKAVYCLACLIYLIQQARFLKYRNNPVEWGWSRDLQSFIFVFNDHNRIVLERPEYGYATYCFEIVHSLPIDWQIKRLVTTMKLTSCSRTILIEDRPLVVGEDLTQGEAQVLEEYGWSPNCGLGSMLHFCGRVLHDNKNEEYIGDWKTKIVKLLLGGRDGPRTELVNIPKKALKLEDLEIKMED